MQGEQTNFTEKGQVDLAEMAENGSGNENDIIIRKENGRQEGYKCGIGQQPCS